MSTKMEDGGSAFPRSEGETSSEVDGMRLRDWFAGQALIGVISRPYDNYASAARVSYALADAMLAARKAGE